VSWFLDERDGREVEWERRFQIIRGHFHVSPLRVSIGNVLGEDDVPSSMHESSLRR
jgi:hypothetical protein